MTAEPAPVAVAPLAHDPAAGTEAGIGAGLDAVLDVVAPDGAFASPLLEAGRDHLDALRAAHPRMHDGTVLRWLATLPGPDGRPTRLQVTTGGYFAMVATCDALRAERLAADPATDDAALPLRRLAHDLAGDPLASGAGRVAALGLSVVVTVPDPHAADPRARSLLLGRRSTSNALDVGHWHVAPSGMVEPDSPDDGRAARPLSQTLVTELAEELGVTLTVEDAAARARVLGVVHDLLRLRPDVAVRLDLTTDEAGGIRIGDEFDDLTRVPLAALRDGDWTPPGPLTPAATGALRLLAQASRQSSSADCQ